MGSGIKKALSKPGIGNAQNFRLRKSYSVRTQEPPKNTSETGLKHASRHPVADPIFDMDMHGRKGRG